MRGRLAVFAVTLSLAGPRAAHAGRTDYGWLYGTDVLPERGAEITSWLSEENNKSQEGHSSETRWWTAPIIGITDQLELVLPIEVAWDRADGAPARTALDRYGIEARYRLVTADPVDAPAFVPLVRVAVERLVLERGTIIPQLDVVAAYQCGRLHAAIDAGFYAEINSNSHVFEAHPGIGVSIQVVGDLRVGAEAFAEFPLNGDPGWAAAGPNLAWSHGRSWISAAYGIGVYHIADAPKVQWGVAF